MDPKPSPGSEVGEGYKYISLGLTFAGGIILFLAIGLWLDRRLGVTPLFTITGTIVGGVLSFVSVMRRLGGGGARRGGPGRPDA